MTKSMTAQGLMDDLNSFEDPQAAQFAQRFFKTYAGGYAEGDVFIGLRVPLVRKLSGNYREMTLDEIEKLLESDIHEHRLAGLIIMVLQAKRATDYELKELYRLYLKRTDRINNWDLVDVSCRDVVGQYLMNRSRAPLYKLAKSKDLWERRIAIVSSWQFIRNNDLADTFKIAAMLLSDDHDLIHKAVGWMLREAGKRDEDKLRAFLDDYAHIMPRTMLRYSLEKLHEADKQHYMRQKAV